MSAVARKLWLEPMIAVRRSTRPQEREVELDRVERFGAHALIFSAGRDELPGVAGEPK